MKQRISEILAQAGSSHRLRHIDVLEAKFIFVENPDSVVVQAQELISSGEHHDFVLVPVSLQKLCADPLGWLKESGFVRVGCCYGVKDPADLSRLPALLNSLCGEMVDLFEKCAGLSGRPRSASSGFSPIELHLWDMRDGDPKSGRAAVLVEAVIRGSWMREIVHGCLGERELLARKAGENADPLRTLVACIYIIAVLIKGALED